MSNYVSEWVAYPKKMWQQLSEVVGLAWGIFVSASLALAISLTFMGRTHPFKASLLWTVTLGAIFCASLIWITVFTREIKLTGRNNAVSALRTLILVHAPLLGICLASSLAVYLSNEFNHYSHTLMHPLPVVSLLLAVVATYVAQKAVLKYPQSDLGAITMAAMGDCARWALPGSLLFIGFLQGASFLWVIGNDFTRYWAVADAISTMAGYPASIHQQIYIRSGMYPYSIELPLFPILLLASFAAVGHDTVGAHLPGLLANVGLPLLIYALYRRAGLARSFAYLATCLVVFFPFLRLYTLNAPVPCSVFMALLVATAWLFLPLAEGQRTSSSRLWLAFGLLGGLTTLTRPEGLFFVGMMFLGLAPQILKRGFWAGIGVFLLIVLPFSLVVQLNFGIPWPRNAGNSFGLQHIAGNLDLLNRASLRWYAHAFGLSPSGFVLLVGGVSIASVVGTLWMGVRRWPLALLSVAAWIHIMLVFTVHPLVSGADQWFDFFRHISYGLPFIALSIFFMGSGVFEYLRARRPSIAQLVLAAMLLCCFYQLNLLAKPSTTYGKGARQLLTSDIWVSLPDIVANRYELPVLTFSNQSGVLVISPDSRYIPTHLKEVKAFFQPVSSLRTGRGGGYHLSSFVVMVFGLMFALCKPGKTKDRLRTPA